MTTPTIAVTCVANDQNGNPVAGAVFTARLDSTEVYQGFVVPERVQAVADSAGIAVLNLWPNALGVAGSLYRVTAVNPDTGRKFLDTTISVPNSPCNLHEILVQGPYPTLDAAAQALIAAQGALAPVTTQAAAALVSATNASASAAAASASQTAAEDSATTAEGAATAAATSQTAAAASAGQAAADALAAGVAADEAIAQQLVASAHATAAAGSAVAAQASQAAAAGSATSAAGSESAASASETSADLSATVASTQATISTTKAAEAAASAAASEASRVASGVSATASQDSANNAASAVVSQLTALKTQTETARDEAVAGLGAADQSASLVQLVNGIAYNTDITGQLYNEIYTTDGVQNRPLPYVLETMLLHINLLFDLAGAAGRWPLDAAETEKVMQSLAGACAAAMDIGSQAARQVNGGSVQLESGTVTQPSLWPAGDRNTGLLFPGADALALATAGLERLRLDANGRLGLGTNAPTGLLDVADDKLRIRTAKTPATATAAGNAGEFCWDASYLYVCTATNQWKRSALATW